MKIVTFKMNINLKVLFAFGLTPSLKVVNVKWAFSKCKKKNEFEAKLQMFFNSDV